MQIKPFEGINFSEFEKQAFKEKNISRFHRDIYIYDEVSTKNGSVGILTNQLLAGVVQVNKLLIRGMPNEKGCIYDRDQTKRMTFVKSIYIYNAFMDENIEDINERFKNAVLRPILGIVGAYTDTKQYVNTSLDNNMSIIDNQFGITIVNFENNSIMSVLCNPLIIQEGLIVKVSRLDIPDPRFNIVRYLDKDTSSDFYTIPSHFTGEDIIRNGGTNIHQYESYHRFHNSFTEENLLQTSKRVFGDNKIRFIREEAGILPFNQYKIKETINLLDRKRALKSLIIDITKASAYSLFESFTMMYETGKKSGFRGIKPPFKQYHIEFMNEKMTYVYTEFLKLCEKITEIFGRVKILLYVNDVEHVARCIFLDDNSSKDIRTVTLRMTKLECINEYILESLYGKQHNVMEFKELHEIDLLNYYSYLNNDSQYNFSGEGFR
jgi:hypothetical protein